jgi:signal transduction histidine kinase
LQPLDKTPARVTNADVREQTLLELAMSDTSDLPATCRAVTEAATVLVDVARASVWRIIGDELVCSDLFLRDEARHVSGQRIPRSSCPHYFEAVAQSMSVVANDVHTDPRVVELEVSYLNPLGIGGMLDTPIWGPGGVSGILCCEHIGGARSWTGREERDAARLADLVARSMETSARRAAEERARIILEAVPQHVLIIDHDGNVIGASAMAAKLLEAEGGTSFAARTAALELRTLAGDVVPLDEWPAERARRGDVVRAEILEISSRITGRKRWLRVTSAPVRVGGNLQGAVLIYEDVGEEVRIERVKREFLSAIAHELRTPTTIARGYAQRLMRTPLRTEDDTRALAAIDRASARIARVAEDLVDLSAITLGRIVLSLEHADLGDLAQRALEVAHSARTHRLTFVPSQTPATVFVDSLRTRRVFGELIENAARWSGAGTEIVIETRVRQDQAQVLVHDHGRGIPLEAREKIFDAFFRANAGAPDDVGGLGIGLFLAREIVQRQGGSISFESAEGVGSTFTVSFPLEEVR